MLMIIVIMNTVYCDTMIVGNRSSARLVLQSLCGCTRLSIWLLNTCDQDEQDI